MTEEFVPPTIKGFSLVDKLGEGTWKQVFLYRNDVSGAPYACKFLTPTELAEQQAAERNWDHRKIWQNEALGGNTTSLPGLAYGTLERADDGSVYYREEVIDRFLSDYLEQQTPKVEEIIAIASGLAEGLRSMHSDVGRAHSDLNPRNIGYTKSGRVKISDFGASTVCENSKEVGALYIRSPERILEGDVSFSSDVWSFGANLYKLFTGVFPLEEDLRDAKDPRETIKTLYGNGNRWNSIIAHRFMRVEGPVVSLGQFSKIGNIPPAFRDLLFSCLVSKDARIKDGEELVKRVNKAVKQYDKTRPKARAIRYGLMAAGLALMVGAGGFAINSHQKERELEAKIEEAQKKLSLEEKLGYARNYLSGTFSRGGDMNALAYNQLDTWNLIFGDKKMAIAAYLNDKAVAEAVAASGGKEDFEAISGFLEKNHPDIYWGVKKVTDDYIDNFVFMGSFEERRKIIEKWKQNKGRAIKRLNSLIEEYHDSMKKVEYHTEKAKTAGGGIGSDIEGMHVKRAETEANGAFLKLVSLSGLDYTELKERLKDPNFRFTLSKEKKEDIFQNKKEGLMPPIE